MITAVDTNILLDILLDDPSFQNRSSALLQEQHNAGRLIICPLVFSELFVFFLRQKKQAPSLHEFLQEMNIDLVPFTEADFVLAAEAWQVYGSSKAVECPSCGIKNSFVCKHCGRDVFWRNHILTDFLIGAHAQHNAGCLLTRDSGYYKKYFSVKIL